MLKSTAALALLAATAFAEDATASPTTSSPPIEGATVQEVDDEVVESTTRTRPAKGSWGGTQASGGWGAGKGSGKGSRKASKGKGTPRPAAYQTQTVNYNIDQYTAEDRAKILVMHHDMAAKSMNSWQTLENGKMNATNGTESAPIEKNSWGASWGMPSENRNAMKRPTTWGAYPTSYSNIMPNPMGNPYMGNPYMGMARMAKSGKGERGIPFKARWAPVWQSMETDKVSTTAPSSSNAPSTYAPRATEAASSTTMDSGMMRDRFGCLYNQGYTFCMTTGTCVKRFEVPYTHPCYVPMKPSTTSAPSTTAATQQTSYPADGPSYESMDASTTAPDADARDKFGCLVNQGYTFCVTTGTCVRRYDLPKQHPCYVKPKSTTTTTEAAATDGPKTESGDASTPAPDPYARDQFGCLKNQGYTFCVTTRTCVRRYDLPKQHPCYVKPPKTTTEAPKTTTEASVTSQGTESGSSTAAPSTAAPTTSAPSTTALSTTARSTTTPPPSTTPLSTTARSTTAPSAPSTPHGG